MYNLLISKKNNYPETEISWMVTEIEITRKQRRKIYSLPIMCAKDSK